MKLEIVLVFNNCTIFAVMNNTNKLKKLVEELDLTTYELAVLVSEVFADCYGSHNYEQFTDTINYKLR